MKEKSSKNVLSGFPILDSCQIPLHYGHWLNGQLAQLASSLPSVKSFGIKNIRNTQHNARTARRTTKKSSFLKVCEAG